MRTLFSLVNLSVFFLFGGLTFAGSTTADVTWRLAEAQETTPPPLPGRGEDSPLPITTTVTAPAAISLPDALALALRANPDLAASSREVQASEAAVQQAGALPNPVLGIIGDNLGNARKTEAGDRTASLQLSQLIELGGKRAARVRLAETELESTHWEYQAKRLEISSQVAIHFVELLAAQGRETLAEETLDLAEQVANVATKRVQAGKASPVEETKARIAQASAGIALEQAKRERMAARKALGALWGEPNPSFQKAVGDLDKIASLPAYETLLERLGHNPELARWTAEIARRQAGIAVERAKAVSDLTLNAGVARFSEFDDHAYTLGIALPLPVFDRNRGGIQEANQRLEKAVEERRATEIRLTAELGQSYERLAAVAQEIHSLRATLLPGAQSAFAAATQGYQLGKFDFLDVLDAQRTLFETGSQHLRALTDYQRGCSEIERLIGGSLEIQTPPPGRP